MRADFYIRPLYLFSVKQKQAAFGLGGLLFSERSMRTLFNFQNMQKLFVLAS